RRPSSSEHRPSLTEAETSDVRARIPPWAPPAAVPRAGRSPAAGRAAAHAQRQDPRTGQLPGPAGPEPAPHRLRLGPADRSGRHLARGTPAARRRRGRAGPGAATRGRTPAAPPGGDADAA